MRLSGGRCAQIRFFIDFEVIEGSILGGIFKDVALFEASSFGMFFAGVQTRTCKDSGSVLKAFPPAF